MEVGSRALLTTHKEIITVNYKMFVRRRHRKGLCSCKQAKLAACNKTFMDHIRGFAPFSMISSR